MTRSPAALLLALAVAIPGSVKGQALKAEGRMLAAAYGSDSILQQPAPVRPRTPGIVKYGKWGAAAVFVGATALGILQHENANNSFDDLRDHCAGAGQCSIGPDGRYTDPTSEALYQQVVDGDRAARAWFIAGQVAFAGASALFIMHLLRERGPSNVPYSGLVVATGRHGTRVGMRLPIRGP